MWLISEVLRFQMRLIAARGGGDEGEGFQKAWAHLCGQFPCPASHLLPSQPPPAEMIRPAEQQHFRWSAKQLWSDDQSSSSSRIDEQSQCHRSLSLSCHFSLLTSQPPPCWQWSRFHHYCTDPSWSTKHYWLRSEISWKHHYVCVIIITRHWKFILEQSLKCSNALLSL